MQKPLWITPEGNLSIIQEGLVELSLVLTGGLGLLLTLQAGADVMLALLHLGNDALFGAAALETTQSALQRLILLDANFRHDFPSLRRIRLNPGCFQGLIGLVHYTAFFPICQGKTAGITKFFWII